MALRYLITDTSIVGGIWANLTDDIWHSLSGQSSGDGGGFTDAVDAMILDSLSDDIIISLSVNPIGPNGLNMLSYIGTMEIGSGNTIDVDGDVTLDGNVTGTGEIECSGDYTVNPNAVLASTHSTVMNGTGTISSTSATALGPLEINTAGTVTRGTDISCGDYTNTAGTFTGSIYAVIASGDVAYVGGTASGLCLDMIGVGKALAWNTGGSALACLTIPITASVTLTANVRWLTAVINGTLNLDGNRFVSAVILQDDFWTQAGSVIGPGDVECIIIDPRSNADTIDITSGNFLSTNSSDLLTLARVCASDITIRGFGAGTTGLASIHSSKCTNIILGASSNQSGSLSLDDGIHEITALYSGDASCLNNAVDFGSSMVYCSGSMNADNITFSGNTPIPAYIDFLLTGSISNTLDKGVNNPIPVFGDPAIAVGLNNDSNIVDYGPNAQSYPGSLATMGAGGGRGAVPF